LVVFALAAGTMAPGVFSRKAKVLLALGWLALIGTLSIRMYFLQGNYTVLGDQLTLIGTLITEGAAMCFAGYRYLRRYTSAAKNLSAV
jgi:hypothetical protein